MSDVTLSYKGSDILELSDSGSATLKTGGTYCEADIEVEYVKPSGGDTDTNVIKGVSSVYLDWEQGLPTKYKIEGTLAGVYFQTQYQTGLINIEEIEVSGTTTSTGFTFNLDGRADEVHALKKINLNFIPLKDIYNCSFVYGTNRNPYFEDLLGLNFIYVGGANYKIGNMSRLGALKNVTCKPNTLGQKDMVATNRNWWSLSESPLLTDDSLLQIANALCSTYTSVLTLHATPKAKLSTITGTVSQVTDDTGTYDFFTADENGTVTLLDFITNTKGWTVA